MVLLIDNYDSFTYNLQDYIYQTGLICRVIRNDELTIEEIADIEFSSIVISPGPKTPGEAGVTTQLINHFKNKKPILGICLGHQAIGECFGALLVKSKAPVHGKTSFIRHTHHFIFNHMPAELEVMRYHSLVLTQLEDTELEVIANTHEGEIMAVAHPILPIVGLQFHPESILTSFGLQMMRNWFESIRR